MYVRVLCVGVRSVYIYIVRVYVVCDARVRTRARTDIVVTRPMADSHIVHFFNSTVMFLVNLAPLSR